MFPPPRFQTEICSMQSIIVDISTFLEQIDASLQPREPNVVRWIQIEFIFLALYWSWLYFWEIKFNYEFVSPVKSIEIIAAQLQQPTPFLEVQSSNREDIKIIFVSFSRILFWFVCWKILRCNFVMCLILNSEWFWIFHCLYWDLI